MGFFKRDEPIHERLAREAGLDFARDVRDLAPAEPIDPNHPFWQAAGIHGVPRAREWDAVASSEAPGLTGHEVSFVALPDGTVVVDEDVSADLLEPLAEAIDGVLDAPYRAICRRQDGEVWSVGAMQIEVIEVPEEIGGDEVDLVLRDGERTLLVDEARSAERVPTIEAFAAQLHDSFVLHASRLDGDLWEITVLPF